MMKTLIDELLAQQSQLQTPVACFSERHDQHAISSDSYRQLIPLSKPAQDEQYAFEVALDRCTGCKACVSACHSLNGLDDHEAWRDTGLLLGGSAAPAWQQTVTSACHHCEDPGCLNGCPVGAYEKEPDTGIVRHLDDQCIGCSYCILKCPYDVPKYSHKRGIVRKCDMCHQRLAVGEAPACVQACPTEAIRIVTVKKSPALSPLAAGTLFSARFSQSSTLANSTITRPTTQYVGRSIPETHHAADRATLVPQHAHWPLVFMLALTQAGIGLCGGAFTFSNASFPHNLLGAALFYLGMTASVFHLGQPLKAWRFFLGLKTSWLSREILAFSLFAPIPFFLTALPFTPDFPHKSQLMALSSHSILPMGLLAIFTSAMIYHDTQRSLWKIHRTALRFFGTTAAFAFLAQPLILTAILLIKLLAEYVYLRHARQEDWSPDQHSARLQLGPLRPIITLRFSLAFLTICIAWRNTFAAFPLLLTTEILERQLFFQSVQSPKMPGYPGHGCSN